MAVELCGNYWEIREMPDNSFFRKLYLKQILEL